MKIKYSKPHNGNLAGHVEEIADAAGKYLIRMKVAEEVKDDTEKTDENIESEENEKVEKPLENEKKEVSPTKKKHINKP